MNEPPAGRTAGARGFSAVTRRHRLRYVREVALECMGASREEFEVSMSGWAP